MSGDDARRAWQKFLEVQDSLPSPEEMRRLLEQVQPALERTKALEQASHQFLEQAQPALEQFDSQPQDYQRFLEQAQPTLEQVDALSQEYQWFLEKAQPALERVDALTRAYQRFHELKNHPLFPELSRRAMERAMEERSDSRLEFHYDRESDTLTISNGREVVSSHDLSEEILAEFDAWGRPAGFVIDCAAELLKPHLLEAMLGLSEPQQDAQ